MGLLSLIRKIDIFGRRIELRLDKHKKHKTICGAMMTLFIFFITIVVVYIYMLQFTKYDNPYLRIYDLRQEESVFINNNKNNTNKIEDNESNIGLKLQLIDQLTNSIIKTDTLIIVASLVHPNKNNINNNDQQNVILQSTVLELCQYDQSFYCIPTDTIIYLTPFFWEDSEQEINSFLQIKVYGCNDWNSLIKDNKDQKQYECKQESEIEQIIQRAVLKIYFNSYQVNPKEYYNPIEKQQRGHQHNLVNKKTNKNQDSIDDINITFQQIIVSTDKGWILDDYQKEYLISYHSHSTLTTSTSLTDPALIQANLYLHNQTHYIERNYSKIQVYLAYIGGIIKMLMLMGEFITRPFVRLSLSIKIVNEVFDFEGGEPVEGSGDLMSIEELMMNDTTGIQQQQNQQNITTNNNIHNTNDNNYEKQNNVYLCDKDIKQYNQNQYRNSCNTHFKRASSIISIQKLKSSSPTLNDLSYNKDKLRNSMYECDEYYSQQPGNLIKMQKSSQSYINHDGIACTSKRNRNISIIQEHQQDAHSISTLQNHPNSSSNNNKHSHLNYNSQTHNHRDSNKDRKSREGVSPSASGLGLKSKYSQNGSSKLSKSSFDNCHLQQLPLNFTINTEEASPIQKINRTNEIKQTFQPINPTHAQNKLMVPNLFPPSSSPNRNINHANNINVNNGCSPNLSQTSSHSLSSSQNSSSSSSSQTSSSQNSQSESSPPSSPENQNNNLQSSHKTQIYVSNSLPSSPTRNQLKNNNSYYPSYKSQRNNINSNQNDNINGYHDSMGIHYQPRQSQKITGEIEEMIHTPNCSKFVSAQMIQTFSLINKQSGQVNPNNLNNETHKMDNSNSQNIIEQENKGFSMFLTVNQNSPLQRRNKSILKNGNGKIQMRHSYSAGDGVGLDSICDNSQQMIAQTPTKSNQNNNNYYRNSEDKSVNFNQQKSESTLRQSPLQNNQSNQNHSNTNNNNRYSLISSPERDQSSSPTYKCPNIKNLCFDMQSSNQFTKINNNIIERRSHSVLASHPNRLFKQPQNIFTRLGQQNLVTPQNNYQNQNEQEIRTRNSSQSKTQLQNRQSMKRFSMIDKQKILAASKLMQNYQNHQETPLQALKDYGKLAQSPKKVKNVDSIFKKLFKQGKVLKMKFYDYITFYLQCFQKIYSEKKKQIKYSKQKVKERLDVVYIMQKLVEIDKLKMLVLSDDQIKLFEFLPKPIVHLNPKDAAAPSSPGLKEKDRMMMMQNAEPQNMQQAWSMLHQQKKPIEKATEAKSDPRDLTSIDIKLIDMIDNRIKNIFENQIQNQYMNNNNNIIINNNQYNYSSPPLQQIQEDTNNSILVLQNQQNNKNKKNITTFENVIAPFENSIAPFETNLTRDNVANETQIGFLDNNYQGKKNNNNNSTLLEKQFGQDRKSLDEINNSKIEIQSSMNNLQKIKDQPHNFLQNSKTSKNLQINGDKNNDSHLIVQQLKKNFGENLNEKNQFFFEIEMQNQKQMNNEYVENKKRQNSINIVNKKQQSKQNQEIQQQQQQLQQQQELQQNQILNQQEQLSYLKQPKKNEWIF